MKIVGCVLDQHDLRLLAVAAFMCALACLTTCALLYRARAADGRVRIAWTVLAAGEFGGGVWSLHFVAMLAYMPALRIGFAAWPTALSVAAAAIGAWAAFSVVLIPRQSTAKLALAAGFLVCGVAVMHYTGVSAMRVPGTLTLDPGGVAWSVAASGAIALAAVRRLRALDTPAQFAAAAALLALAIFALHFQGMSAIDLQLGGPAASTAGELEAVTLAASVAVVSIALLAVGLALTVMDWHLSQRQSQEKERLRQLVGISFEGLLIERDGVVLDVNERLCELAGRDASSLIGQPLDRLALRPAAQDGTGAPSQEQHLLRSDGGLVPVECLVRPVTYEGRPANAIALRDLTDRHSSEAALIRMAHHDPLTGLPNRLLLDKRMTESLAAGSAAGRSVAVLCLDLDGFKSVNDLHGHAVGDELLIQVARRLEAELREEDTLARLGGDEFVVVVPAKPGSHDALADRLVRTLSQPFVAAGQPVVVGASIGIALCPAHARDGAELLRCADIAMYCAKDAGRHTFRVFDPAMDQFIQDQQALERDLREAMEQDTISLHYQPLVNAMTGCIEGYEALLRWQHPTRGMVPPSVFVPLAEEKQLIQPLGRWVLETACREAAGWEAPLRVAVNLSPRQFRHADLPDYVFDMLRRTGLPPDRLELEVTEGVLIDDPDHAVHMLSTLRAGGVRVSLDDFGTGYSSLSYLRRFPLDKIKIDKSFVDGLAGSDPQSASIVAALIALAHTLGLSVTAEGVETVEQLQELQRRACNQVQGYLLGKPSRERLTGMSVAVGQASPVS